jgi:hypothetical protein
MFKINEEYFSCIYDASKYVLRLAAEGKAVCIRKAQPGEALLFRLRSK